MNIRQIPTLIAIMFCSALLLLDKTRAAEPVAYFLMGIVVGRIWENYILWLTKQKQRY